MNLVFVFVVLRGICYDFICDININFPALVTCEMEIKFSLLFVGFLLLVLDFFYNQAIE